MNDAPRTGESQLGGRPECVRVRDNDLVVDGCPRVSGAYTPPPDKSIAHRALMLAALCDGPVRIPAIPASLDVAQTVACLRALGVTIDRDAAGVVVHGRGVSGLAGPFARLECGRSGTTMRLLAGLLSGQERAFELTADPQLGARPMQRVVDPLVHLGADLECAGGLAPIRGRGRRLPGGRIALPVANAQVSSAVLLAHLTASGPVEVSVPAPVRDHTERMLAGLGAPIERRGLATRLDAPTVALRTPGGEIAVPGDISSAAFLIAAAAAGTDSRLVIDGLGLNPGRTGFLDALVAMGADIALDHTSTTPTGEPVGRLTIASRPLSGLYCEEVARAIDELPLVAVLGCSAHGVTQVTGASDLRVKETDRISAIVVGLRAFGAAVTELPDGFRVSGPCRLRGTAVDGRGDHRIVMALAVAGLGASGETVIHGADAIVDSYPGFVNALNGVMAPSEGR